MCGVCDTIKKKKKEERKRTQKTKWWRCAKKNSK